ncbi:pilus assembly protein [Methylosinus sporium]|uniref:Pilus assembly protein n=1 Tax=Methylosinus sporium TaxID=428 RepID=A0A549SRG7_METSR|nr:MULTISPECIES: pilus assembly protein TadG-related protein [Methylosinus]MBU3886978.1 pilus assembly protein [Methylosinus sp. KRF6]TRL32220.1 pilus assembly protein [Methylosinus sporium]
MTIFPALARFFAHRKGNVAIIFALTAIPLMIAAGGAVDYASAGRVKTQLYAAADAAALAATTPPMMLKSEAVAKAAATTMFAAQAAQITRQTYNAANLAIDVHDKVEPGSMTRSVSVTYTTQVPNSFGAFYGLRTSNITVNAVASATTARNIDFYLLLDNSPSMELPATQAGVDAMNATGCAFACHEKNLSDGEYTNKYAGWGTIDSYAYAKNNGIKLRIDNVREAAKSLASTAQSLMSSNGATYRLAAYNFNYAVSMMQSLVPTTSANVSLIQANIETMTPPLMDSNNYLASNSSYTYPTGVSTYNTVTTGGALRNNDAMTDLNQAFTKLNATMPAPGSGTTAAGDTPQEVLMLVTDGVIDASNYSNTSCTTSINSSYSNSYGSFYRCLQPVDVSYCTAIKNRGIRIAVLYTTYYPVPSNGFYNATVATFASQISDNLKSCASSSDLYFEVNTGGNITTALATLFQKAVSTASHLTQ